MPQLYDYYLNPSATWADPAINNDGMCMMSYQGRVFPVTECCDPSIGGGWWHIRITAEQKQYMDDENVSYQKVTHPAATVRTDQGGPNHLYGVDGEANWWLDTSDNLYMQKPTDADPTLVEE